MRWFPTARRWLGERLRFGRWRRSADEQASTDRIKQLDEQLVSGLAERRVPSFGQLWLLPRILNRRERVIVALLVMAFLAAMVLLLLRLVGRFSNPIPVAGGSYVEGVIGTPQNVNPVFAMNSNDADEDLIKLVYAGLFRVSSDHAVVPDLAESHAVSPDGKAYTVTLRSGLQWSDGAPLTINDVLFTFALIQDPAFKSPLYAAFRSVTIERVDERTLTFTLKQPLAPFLASLSVGLLPEHRWSEIQPTNARLNKLNLDPIGAGPYRIAEYRFDPEGNIREYELVPNERYHGVKPKIAKLTFRFFPDAPTAIDALKGKKIDGLSLISPENRGAVNGTAAHIVSLRLPRYTAVFFNQKRRGLKSPELREALTLAINRSELARLATDGTGEVANGPLPQGFPGSVTPELNRPYDTKRAEELLDQAGWKRGDDGFRKKGVDVLTLTLTTSDKAEYSQVADLIKTAWEAIGVKTEVEVVPAGRINRDVIRPRNYDVILFSQVVGADPDLFPFWHSSQETDPGLNLAIFYKKEADKLLEEARTIQDPGERMKKNADFQKLLNEALPAIFLYQPSYLYVLPKKIRGFTQTSIHDPSDRFSDISSWYIKTKRRFR